MKSNTVAEQANEIQPVVRCETSLLIRNLPASTTRKNGSSTCFLPLPLCSSSLFERVVM
jgi:hypothetical protein